LWLRSLSRIVCEQVWFHSAKERIGCENLSETVQQEINYSLMIHGSDGLTYHADVKKNADWIQTKLGLDIINHRIRELEIKLRNYDQLQSTVNTLIEMFKPELRKWIEKAFLKWLGEIGKTKSFQKSTATHAVDTRLKLQYPIWHLSNEIFDALVHGDYIEDRGHGWYRSNLEIRKS
jgi:hypothetical protein